jgi:hypothetical protein
MFVAHLALNTSSLQPAAEQSNLGTIWGGEQSLHNVITVQRNRIIMTKSDVKRQSRENALDADLPALSHPARLAQRQNRAKRSFNTAAPYLLPPTAGDSRCHVTGTAHFPAMLRTTQHPRQAPRCQKALPQSPTRASEDCTIPGPPAIASKRLKDKADMLHFDAASQRELGRRYAKVMLQLQFGRGR